jgi:hypothetical protein
MYIHIRYSVVVNFFNILMLILTLKKYRKIEYTATIIALRPTPRSINLIIKKASVYKLN